MKKKVVIAAVLVIIVVVELIAVAKVAGIAKQIELPLLVRDWVMATVAMKKAGPNVPYEADYSLSQPYDPSMAWGIDGNSLYLNELARRILPYFMYEGILEYETWPAALLFLPLDGQKSFHNLGTADSQNRVIRINERFLLEDIRQDERQMLSTLIHELAHLQGGNFLGGPPNWLESSKFESNTQSATIEILAGMCNHGDELACKAFWDEIYTYARGSFRMRLRRWGLEDLYYPLARVFWWDEAEGAKADKSLRYWMEDDERAKYLYSIIYDYQQRPWEDNVLAGILGQDMPTGIEGKCEYSASGEPRCKEYEMSFNDTRYILGDLLISFIDWLTQ